MFRDLVSRKGLVLRSQAFSVSCLLNSDFRHLFSLHRRLLIDRVQPVGNVFGESKGAVPARQLEDPHSDISARLGFAKRSRARKAQRLPKRLLRFLAVITAITSLVLMKDLMR